MLKGSRDGIIRRVQPVSIHGQLSLDIYFVDADDADGREHFARVGAESAPRVLSPGDRVELDYLLGTVTTVRRTGQ